MAGDKIQISAARRRRVQLCEPVAQGLGVFEQVGVEQQRRQGKLIDQMRLVALPEIADVLGVRHVGFGQQAYRDATLLEQDAQHLHHHVRFRQAAAIAADAFPQKGDGIEADIARPVAHVAHQNFRKAEQHVGVAKVQVDLVFAEGRPDVRRTLPGWHHAEQRRVARAHHLVELWRWLAGQKIVAAGQQAANEVRKPQMLPGAVIDDQIEHQLKALGQRLDVLPVTEVIADAQIVGDGKAVIGGKGKEGQHMNRREQSVQMPVCKTLQRPQRWHRVRKQAVTVGNEYLVLFAEANPRRRRVWRNAVSGIDGGRAMSTHNAFQPARHHGCSASTVKMRKQLLQPVAGIALGGAAALRRQPGCRQTAEPRRLRRDRFRHVDGISQDTRHIKTAVRRTIASGAARQNEQAVREIQV